MGSRGKRRLAHGNRKGQVLQFWGRIARKALANIVKWNPWAVHDVGIRCARGGAVRAEYSAQCSQLQYSDPVAPTPVQVQTGFTFGHPAS